MLSLCAFPPKFFKPVCNLKACPHPTVQVPLACCTSGNTKRDKKTVRAKEEGKSGAASASVVELALFCRRKTTIYREIKRRRGQTDAAHPELGMVSELQLWFCSTSETHSYDEEYWSDDSGKCTKCTKIFVRYICIIVIISSYCFIVQRRSYTAHTTLYVVTKRPNIP